ncbi:MAG: 8-amino-7-oxononanoate synthase, partial [Candidatus Acidiferrales bacterium]
MSTPTARPQMQFLREAIEEMKAKNLYFRLKILEGEQKPAAIFDGQEVINLSSNNYLGLTTHPKLRRAAIDAIRKFGVGSGAVRTIAG